MPDESGSVRWGRPGETGVSSNGVPWYVPEKGPSRTDRLMQKVFRLKGSDRPLGARDIPARTAAEVRERLQLFGLPRHIAERVNPAPGEEIEGYITFEIGKEIPQPPITGIGRKAGPLPGRKSRMGGDWDSMAGNLLIAIGRSYNVDEIGGTAVDVRSQVWVRTNLRTVILRDTTHSPGPVVAEYRPGEAGIHPGWQPYPDTPDRVDIAFADGSWLGVDAHDIYVPGGTEGHPERDLLAELAGPPVTGAPR